MKSLPDTKAIKPLEHISWKKQKLCKKVVILKAMNEMPAPFTDESLVLTENSVKYRKKPL